MQYSLFQYSLKLTSLPAVGIDVHCASLGDWLPSAAGKSLPITRLISAALSSLQKFSGTCTANDFDAAPESWEHPLAATTAAATAAHVRRLPVAVAFMAFTQSEPRAIRRPVTMRAARRRAEEPGHQNSANCSPACAASAMVPPTVALT